MGWLDDAASTGRGIRWISKRKVCIYDAEIARALLRNDGGRMVDHSDFFGNKASAPPRQIQIALARQALALVHDCAQNVDCEAFVLTLDQRIEWPRAGNALLMKIMRPVLAASWRSQALHEALDRMVSARILSRHEPAVGTIRRVRNRYRFHRTVVSEADTSEGKSGLRDDVLGVVQSYKREIGDVALVQLYAGFVFSTVGSIGFALAWALFHGLRQQALDHHPARIVLEAMRLNPVAWVFERRVRQSTTVLGERVLPHDVLVISPYAVHRNSAYWNEPTRFLPERWSTSIHRDAFLPFGTGDHGCVAAGLSVSLASRLLAEILRRAPEIEYDGGPPSIGAALAPPRFTVRLSAAGR